MMHRTARCDRRRFAIAHLLKAALALSIACGAPAISAQAQGTAPTPPATSISPAVPPPMSMPASSAPGAAPSATSPEAAPATTPGAAPQVAPAETTSAPATEVSAGEPAANVPSASEPSASESPASEPSEDDHALPRDLSPLGMFMAADIIVKAVMIGLVLASVLTWSVWLAKVIELFAARRKARRDTSRVAQSRTLADAHNSLSNINSDVAMLCRAAADEIRRSSDAMNPDGIKERVASHFSRIEAAAARRMTRGTGILATIGSTAPFVGLFGTVWGIMNSFIGISKAQTTNLAVVAPGIAEALLATALGLVAAIPAVIIFNMFARSIAGYRGLLGDGSAELMRMVSRDLDRTGGYRQQPRAAAAE